MSGPPTRTPIDFVLFVVQEYVEGVLKKEYATTTHLPHWHMLILVRQLCYKPYLFARAEGVEAAIYMAMQQLVRMESIISFVLFTDGDEPSAGKEGRRLRTLIYMREGCLCQHHSIQQTGRGATLRAAENDLWFDSGEEVFGNANPFSTPNRQKMDARTAVIAKTLKAHIKRAGWKTKRHDKGQSGDAQ